MKNLAIGLAVLGLAFASSGHAAEVFCSKLNNESHTINFRRQEVGGNIIRLPAPTTTVEAVPARTHAGPRGENLAPDQCSLKSTTFAPRYTKILIHFINGENFRYQQNKLGKITSGWSELSGMGLKTFSFEGEFTIQDNMIVFTVDLSKNPVVYY